MSTFGHANVRWPVTKEDIIESTTEEGKEKVDDENESESSKDVKIVEKKSTKTSAKGKVEREIIELSD
jgi:hypothetical protein